MIMKAAGLDTSFMFKNERAYLSNLVDHWRGALAFFSNPNKLERERTTVRAFLKTIGEEFVEGEIVRGAAEPVDISFRSARFQIKEALGGRKRTDEFRERLLRAQNAVRVKDVGEPWTSSVEMPFEEALQLIASSLETYARRLGPNQCAELDALVYVNLGGRHLWPPEIVGRPRSAERLNQQNWRSVSMLFPPYGLVITAQSSAPDFLRDRIGLILRCSDPGGCF